MRVCEKKFLWDEKEYIIAIELEDNGLAGDFVVRTYYNNQPAFAPVREKAMQALCTAMENGKSPFSDIITVAEYNIKQGFNRIP